MGKSKNIEVYEAQETTTNVFEEEFVWKIHHFKLENSNSIALKLAHGIECTVALIANQQSYVGKFKKTSEKVFRKAIVAKPFLIISKIPEGSKYIINFEMKPEGKQQRSFSYISEQKAIISHRGIPAKGAFISTMNINNFRNKDNSITFNMKFTVQELEDVRPFDREDFTIERTLIAMDLTNMFMNEKFSDISLNIGDDKVPAHKAMLAAHSKFFERVLAEQPDISEFTFQKRAEKEVYIEFLRFIYNNTIKDLEKNFDGLMEFALEYEVEGLKKLCHLEIVSRVTYSFGRLTKRTRNVPIHILKDFEKVQKFQKMLIDLKELMRAKMVEPIEEPSTDEDEVIVMDIADFPVDSNDSENDSETNFNNLQKNIVIETDEVLTDSMTKLISTTLDSDEKKNDGIEEKIDDVPMEKEKFGDDETDKGEKMIEDEAPSAKQEEIDLKSTNEVNANNENETREKVEVPILIEDEAPSAKEDEVSAPENAAPEEEAAPEEAAIEDPQIEDQHDEIEPMDDANVNGSAAAEKEEQAEN